MDLGLVVTGSNKGFTPVKSLPQNPRQSSPKKKQYQKPRTQLPKIQKERLTNKKKIFRRSEASSSQILRRNRVEKSKKRSNTLKNKSRTSASEETVQADNQKSVQNDFQYHSNEKNLGSEVPNNEKVEPVFQTATVVVKYSHYKDKFTAPNGRLPWKSVDDQYCISFVFKGNFQVSLIDEDVEGGEIPRDSSDGCFPGILEGHEYLLVVEEDPEFIVESKPIVFAEKREDSVLKTIRGQSNGNRRVDEITQQLKNLSPSDLRNQTDEYKKLIEERDIEDCLYNNG